MSKKKYKVFLFFLYILVFNNVIEYNFGGFSLIDEIYSYLILIFLIFICILKKQKMFISKNEFKILIFVLIMIIIGLLSNMIYGYQRNIYAIISSLNTFKFVFAYFCTKIMFADFSLDENKIKINKSLKFITVILLIIGGICNIFNPNKTVDSTYRINSLIMFFSHPTYLNACCVSLITLFTYYLKYFKENKFYITVLLFIMTLTLKGKAFMFIGVYILFIIYYITANKNKKMWFLSRSILFFTIIPIGLFIWNKFYQRFIYFTVTYSNTARSVLMDQSLNIALNKFPLGLGFGTFGSAISGSHYSNVYYDYGLYNIYGLRPEDPKYVSDTFWPMILAENGVLGLLLFLIILVLFVKEILKWKKSGNFWFCGFIPLIYLIIASLGESSFANQIGVTMFFLIAIINVSSKNIKKNKV